MKKSLFAIAAVTAFAGAAQAQSSVTVYGILDVGFIGGNNRGATTAGASDKNTYSQFGSGAESTSRLGFRGREDLGGGTAAFFTVEMNVTPNSVTIPLGGNRQTFVGISQKGYGQVAIGTQNTIIHNAVGVTSAGQQNNIVGDVIYPIAPPGASGNTVGAGQFGAITNNSNGVSAGTTGGYTIRTNNMLSLRTENIAGFVGNAFYTMANNDSTQTSVSTSGPNNKNGWGIGANYTWKKLLLTANYQSFEADQPTSTTVTLWNDTTVASNVRDNQQYYAAAYNFGILTAYAQYVQRKAISQLNAANILDRSAQQLGVRGFFTPKIEGWASYGMGKFNSMGTTAGSVNFTGYQLGSNYYLSKRTNLYAIFGSTSQSSANVASQPSMGANNYAVGVRHTF